MLRQREGSATDRANPLPSGTLAVGVGLVISGITAYAFLSVTAHVLSDDASAPLAAIWAVMFTVAPGFFMPIEQEVSRAVASRGVHHHGAGPLIRRAGVLALGLLGVLTVAAAATSPILTDKLFDGHWALFAALVFGIAGYCAAHLTRGVLSGRGAFAPYSVYLGGEAVLRLVICIVLAIAGARSAGPYGIAIGIAPILAVAVVANRALPAVHEPGPPAPWSELTPSLGALLAGSVCSMALMNAAMIGAQLLKTEGQDAEVKRVFNGVIVARVPLFLFQAVQAALLPKLSALAGARRYHEFRSSMRRLVQAVAAIGLLGALGGFALGPFVVELAFDVELGHLDVGLLAAATGFFIVAMSFAQALIALGGQGRVALSWFAGVVAFVAVTALGNDLLLRLELASLVSSGFACGLLAWFLQTRLQHDEAEEDREQLRVAV